ncbi:uncharacterized protein LOC117317597 [Pecten maximus]|uniref:uncharacterized protein LOC117317597 n=1 Tax=Pecten maximus TaxID=6579 RepID=UPI001457F076|nr:uncharacterized protein LOC117317597 [Pecten maximus]XP_033728338.1 uncharacterized protein LOC117317597 [Pecten maximus]
MAEKASTSQADDDQQYKIRMWYSDMVIHLSEMISPDRKLTWQRLLTALEPLLPHVLHGDDITYIGDILEKLRAKGKIDPMKGSFEELHDALLKVDVEAAEVVKETSIKIKALLSEGQPAAKKRRTERDGNQIRATEMTISTHKLIYEVQEGSGAAFINCNVDPVPNSIQWKRDKIPPPKTRVLMDNNKYFYGGEAPSLVIKTPNKLMDEGYYQCTAEANGKSVDGDVVQLKVYALDKETEYKRSMRRKLETKNIKLTFIGHARAGKTSLMRQLLRKQIKPGGPEPTNMAELLSKRIRYKLGKSGKEREKIEKGKDAELCSQRLRQHHRNVDDGTVQEMETSNALSNDDTGYPGQSEEGAVASHTIVYEGPPRPPQPITEDQRKDIEDYNKEDDSVDDPSTAYVTMFDFGGDEVFHTWHQCVMSTNSIYLLVFDVSLWENPDKQDIIVDEIAHWLNAVATYSQSKSGEKKCAPPIILIGSHMDKIETVSMLHDDVFENTTFHQIYIGTSSTRTQKI